MVSPDDVGGYLDLCAPPEGRRFCTGIWLAHDVDLAMVADTVAPALVGELDPDPERRRRVAAQTGADGEGLVVVGASTRLGAVHAFADWVSYLPVTGRPQHAKAGVLQFRRSGSLRSITRAFVTSANLTRGSLSNREILVWEETGSQTHKPTLAHDILNAAAELAEHLDTRSRDRLSVAIGALQSGLAHSSPAACVRHSLTATRPILADIGVPRGAADRIVVVSPAFAGDDDTRASDYLTPWIGRSTRVDVFTGVDAEPGDVLGPTRRPAFSRAVLDGLASASGTPPRVWGVPQFDEDGRRRALHAKAVAVVHGDSAVVILGSANCSRRGLGGENRELVVRCDWSRSQLEQWLAELGALRFDGVPASPPLRQAPPMIAGELALIRAEFRPDVGQTVRRSPYRGLLRLEWSKEANDLVLRYRGETVPLIAEQDLRLDERAAWLDATAGPTSWRVPIQIVDVPPNFWHAGPDVEDGEDPEVLALLRVLRTDRTDQEARTPHGNLHAARADDRFHIPLLQRLNVVARCRSQLRERLPDGLGEYGERLLPDPTERAVADALLGGGQANADLLLRLLAKAADDLGTSNG